MTPPQPRPALRRADDATVHPALSIAPSQAPPALRSTRATEPAPQPEPKPKGKKAKGKKQDAPRFRGAGKATSDVWRGVGGSDKPVRLDVTVPKSLRKELRAVSKASGTPVDALVAQALTAWLGDPRQW